MPGVDPRYQRRIGVSPSIPLYSPGGPSISPMPSYPSGDQIEAAVKQGYQAGQGLMGIARPWLQSYNKYADALSANSPSKPLTSVGPPNVDVLGMPPDTSNANRPWDTGAAPVRTGPPSTEEVANGSPGVFDRLKGATSGIIDRLGSITRPPMTNSSAYNPVDWLMRNVKVGGEPDMGYAIAAQGAPSRSGPPSTYDVANAGYTPHSPVVSANPWLPAGMTMGTAPTPSPDAPQVRPAVGPAPSVPLPPPRPAEFGPSATAPAPAGLYGGTRDQDGMMLTPEQMGRTPDFDWRKLLNPSIGGLY